MERAGSGFALAESKIRPGYARQVDSRPGHQPLPRLRLTSQISSAISVMPTYCPANTLLRLILRFPRGFVNLIRLGTELPPEVQILISNDYSGLISI
jgi:hypothetical protein